MKRIKTILLVVLAVAIVAFAACAAPAEEAVVTLGGVGEAGGAGEEAATQAPATATPEAMEAADTPSGNPQVEITMEDGGKILVELDPEAAPKTVENFLKLVNEGFYDGLTFHRIIPGFMIQGGDPDGLGTGGSDEEIVGEFSSNNVDNPISHVRGVISMARSNDPDSASSQFFITNADSTFLDGDYAAFGTVIDGMDVVDKISGVETDASDYPVEPVVIQSIKEVG